MCAFHSSTSLTPYEIIRKYPHVEGFGWNASKIGTFFSAGLLLGKRKLLKSLILESSFLELMAYFDKVAEKKRMATFGSASIRRDYLTPEELIHKYAQVVDELDWNASKVGIFFSSGLLLGYRNGKEYKAMIDETSFRELIDYATGLSIRRK